MRTLLRTLCFHVSILCPRVLARKLLGTERKLEHNAGAAWRSFRFWSLRETGRRKAHGSQQSVSLSFSKSVGATSMQSVS